MRILVVLGALALVAGTSAAAAVEFRGVPLGISIEKFRQLRPAAKCDAPFGTVRCVEDLPRSADFPFRSKSEAIDYAFSDSGRLIEITMWGDYADEKWVEAKLRRTWGAPYSTKDEDGDPELKWRRDGAIIRFNPDCEDGAICVEYKLPK